MLLMKNGKLSLENNLNKKLFTIMRKILFLLFVLFVAYLIFGCTTYTCPTYAKANAKVSIPKRNF